MIHHKLIPIMRCTLLVGVVVSSSWAEQDQGPCAQIIAACKNAAFVQGGASSGSGLLVDCVRPIMQGKAAKHKASKPLPRVDPQLVAACKAKNPAFGQPRGSLAEAGEEQPVSAPPPPAHAAAPGSPNIVFILTDDLSMNLVQFMPHVLKMQKEGVTFANYFVTDSLCCPSRSSIFTGRYPHDTGVFKNTGRDGGYIVFRARGNEQSTFATALSTAGYRTAFLGKYLNGYQPERHHPIAAGWNTWVVAGNGYKEFHYVFNQDGQLVPHGFKPADYLTDVVADLGVRFIKQQRGAPFFVKIATFAPHAPYTPAPPTPSRTCALRARRPTTPRMMPLLPTGWPSMPRLRKPIWTASTRISASARNPC